MRVRGEGREVVRGEAREVVRGEARGGSVKVTRGESRGEASGFAYWDVMEVA